MDNQTQNQFSLREQIDICSKQYVLFVETAEEIKPKVSEQDKRLINQLTAISELLLTSLQNNTSYWDE